MALGKSFRILSEAEERAERVSVLSDFLTAIADHVELPSHQSWVRLVECAQASEIASRNDTGKRWATGLGDRAEGLIAGSVDTWTGLMVDILSEGDDLLRQGGGARLKAISPFAGMTLVAYRDGIVRGETALAFHDALEDAGEETGYDHSTLIVMERGDLAVPRIHRDNRT